MISTEMLLHAAFPAILLGWAFIVVLVFHKMLDRSNEEPEQDLQSPADGVAQPTQTSQKDPQ